MEFNILICEKEQDSALEDLLKQAGCVLFRAENSSVVMSHLKKGSIQALVLDADFFHGKKELSDFLQSLPGATTKNGVPPLIFVAAKKNAKLPAIPWPEGTQIFTKPYDKASVIPAIKLAQTMANLQYTVRKQQHKLLTYQRYLSHEKAVATEILATVSRSGCLEDPHIRHCLPPLALFNGDLLMAALKPSGDFNIMLGEFSGQVLPAAVSALPLAEVFYTMTHKGYSISQILVELNHRIKSIFHYGVFFAVCFVEIDTQKGVLHVWNGGMPDSYLCHANGHIKSILAAHYLPLGMIEDADIHKEIQIESINNGERIFLFSQNIVNLSNSENHIFGKENLQHLLNHANNGDTLFDDIVAAVRKHAGDVPDVDSITLAEVVIAQPALELPQKAADSGRDANALQAKEWRLLFELRPDSLRSLNPLPVILHVLMECADLQAHRTAVYTIISELYSNALEHGVLGLDSKLKMTADGFLDYYQKRTDGLAALKDGFVRFKIYHQSVEGEGRLVFEIEDSGPGFDYHSFMNKNFKKSGYSGRGVPLIQSLCEEVSYYDKGNAVRAVYVWKKGEEGENPELIS